ncbi:hypothetical protein DFH06DRAFT_1127021 [Mycena polygramma]|nr:hypothetical protein DFH06DRAFT_1127021 [Mycena polygramma]
MFFAQESILFFPGTYMPVHENTLKVTTNIHSGLAWKSIHDALSMKIDRKIGLDDHEFTMSSIVPSGSIANALNINSIEMGGCLRSYAQMERLDLCSTSNDLAGYLSLGTWPTTHEIESFHWLHGPHHEADVSAVRPIQTLRVDNHCSQREG